MTTADIFREVMDKLRPRIDEQNATEPGTGALMFLDIVNEIDPDFTITLLKPATLLIRFADGSEAQVQGTTRH